LPQFKFVGSRSYSKTVLALHTPSIPILMQWLVWILYGCSCVNFGIEGVHKYVSISYTKIGNVKFQKVKPDVKIILLHNWIKQKLEPTTCYWQSTSTMLAKKSNACWCGTIVNASNCSACTPWQLSVALLLLNYLQKGTTTLCASRAAAKPQPLCTDAINVPCL